jgi:putative flippase GtrA
MNARFIVVGAVAALIAWLLISSALGALLQPLTEALANISIQ